jgi:type IV pilus assembly protein PilC
LVYPVAVLVIAAVVVAVILIWVVPVFQSIFESFGAQLPAPTRFILNMSAALVHGGLPMLMALLCTYFFVQRHYQRSDHWQWRLAVWSLRIPVIAGLIRSSNLAVWTRCLAMLCQSGVALLDALEVLAGVCHNRVYAMACLDIRQSVLRGSGLAASMERLSASTPEHQRLFPALLVQMIDIGEHSGTLTSLLSKAADAQEFTLEQRILGLTQLIEPLLVVVLGGVVGGMVVALYLPVFQLGQVM